MSLNKYQSSTVETVLSEHGWPTPLGEVEVTGVETIAYSALEISQSASLWAERSTKFSPAWH